MSQRNPKTNSASAQRHKQKIRPGNVVKVHSLGAWFVGWVHHDFRFSACGKVRERAEKVTINFRFPLEWNLLKLRNFQFLTSKLLSSSNPCCTLFTVNKGKLLCWGLWRTLSPDGSFSLQIVSKVYAPLGRKAKYRASRGFLVMRQDSKGDCSPQVVDFWYETHDEEEVCSIKSGGFHSPFLFALKLSFWRHNV